MSTFHTPRFVMISLLQHLTGEARCLTDNKPRDGSLEEARRGQKTKRKQSAGRRSTGRPETGEEKDNSALFPHTQLLSQLICDHNHISDVGPEPPPCQLNPALHRHSAACKQDSGRAGLAQSAARCRRRCHRLTQNLLHPAVHILTPA